MSQMHCGTTFKVLEGVISSSALSFSICVNKEDENKGAGDLLRCSITYSKRLVIMNTKAITQL
jgi:hypothetical protein